MIVGVADTHAVLWHLFDDPRLSRTASSFIEQAAIARNHIVISTISLAEIVYLVEKSRLPAKAYEDLRAVLADADHVLKEAPLTAEIVEAMRLVPRDEVPDLPDRIVAATGVHFKVPVISRDGCIRASQVETVW